MVYRDRLVAALRQSFKIACCTDDELLKVTKNTLTRNIIEIELAAEDLSRVMKPVIEKVAKDIKRAFSKI